MAKFTEEVDSCVKFVECHNTTSANVLISTESGCQGIVGKRELKLFVNPLKINVQGKLVLGDCKR